MKSVHEKLGNAADRSAFFHLRAGARHGPTGIMKTVEGRIDGEIVWPRTRGALRSRL